jgi:biotin carboxyl carrier protein
MPIITISSEVNARVVQVKVQPGQTVQQDEVLAVLESMKMEISITSEAAGVIKAVHVTEGVVVEEGQAMFDIG